MYFLSHQLCRSIDDRSGEEKYKYVMRRMQKIKKQFDIETRANILIREKISQKIKISENIAEKSFLTCVPRFLSFVLKLRAKASARPLQDIVMRDETQFGCSSSKCVGVAVILPASRAFALDIYESEGISCWLEVKWWNCVMAGGGVDCFASVCGDCAALIKLLFRVPGRNEKKKKMKNMIRGRKWDALHNKIWLNSLKISLWL